MAINPISILGALPVGDPDAMRQHAASLRADAGEIRSAAQGLLTVSQGMPFEAPAADRMRTQFAAEASTLRGYAERLEMLAAHLTNSAANVADAQASWRASAQRLLDDAKHIVDQVTG